jgi:hypothetical protein
MSWLEIWAMMQVLAVAIPVGILVLLLIYFVVAETLRQYFCKHEKFYENMACHGVCRKCGKDLGFIGNLRK